MKFTTATEQEIWPRRKEFHVLTYAEEGFAPLSIHGEERGVDAAVRIQFADKTNQRNEAGSLHPRASISAVTRSSIREPGDGTNLTRQIIDFLKANQSSIRATRLLCDFRTPSVPPLIVAAVQEALKAPYAARLDEVVVVI